MNKRNFVALFTTLTLFLLAGCAQESAEPTNKKIESTEIEEANTISKSEEPKKAESPANKDEDQASASNEVSGSLSELNVHFIDVGQADSTLLQYSHDGDDFTILIDAGNWNRNDVVNYLNAQNVSQIDIVIGTHPDADHIGQLDKVLNTFDVGEVWLSGNTSNSQTFQRLLAAIDSSGADYYEPRMGDEFEVGPLAIEILYPQTISENDNGESISLKLTYGDTRFLFTGDASKTDELNMLQSGIDIQADILQLGHHGSSTSTHTRFLSEVNPSTAIYSAGSENSYGHPHEEVVDLVQAAGVQLYGTDVHGTVIVSTNGKDYTLLTNKDGTISPSSSNEPTASKEATSSPPVMPTGNCIDVNSSTFEQVQEIVHIGPARAEDLINLRPYNSVDDLSKINGIGPARIEDIKSQGLACIGG